MTRIITKEDHATLAKWWQSWGWPVTPIDCLPRYGVIADNTAAGFLYNTDSKLCWIGWLVTNKSKSIPERSESINAVLKALEAKAKEIGKQGIFTFTAKPSLIRRHLAHGYTLGDEGVTQLTKWMGE